ncbi:MAG: Caspase domain [Pseudomonadota bacterium]|jgi:hypothetical protein
MKASFKKALGLLSVAGFVTACGTTSEGTNSIVTPPLEQKSENSDSSRPSDQSSTNTNSGTGKNYFYSFVRSNPDDSAAMQKFGSDQTLLVSNAVKSLSGQNFTVDVEASPLKVRVAEVKAKLAELTEKVTAQDTVVIYTHSHGLELGLGIDWETRDRNLVTYKWNEYAEAIVNLPAKNVIVFTMSCHSGYLVEALQKIESKWKGSRKSAGRSLIVLTAVSKEQLSRATDQNLTSGIGNPFSYSVRTALSGAADGVIDGKKDGKTTFDELVKYVLKTAKEKSTQQYAEPQFAGEYVSEGSVF